ncbi:hypothetical protein CLOP_g22009 [Closterium sp. NIES-67]|nr:hypothetical protein CLOP_g22009 [Closterium sp. NIES-67]
MAKETSWSEKPELPPSSELRGLSLAERRNRLIPYLSRSPIRSPASPVQEQSPRLSLHGPSPTGRDSPVTSLAGQGPSQSSPLFFCVLAGC